jgi:hypothetical protein
LLTHLLALLEKHGWLIVYNSFSIITGFSGHLSLANRPRFFAIILIIVLNLIFII